MTTAADRQELRKLEKFALEKGAYRARGFSARLVEVDVRVRMKCQIPLCPHYGRCLTCPPNVPTVEEFKKTLRNYETALLVQTRTPLSGEMEDYDKEEVIRFLEAPGKHSTKGAAEHDSSDDFNNVRLAAVRLHKLVNELEGKAMSLGFPYALGLIGGECMLCPECVGVASGERCRRPYQARPSMEAVGIDVMKTSLKAGLPFDVPPKKEIIWSGLVLVD